MRKILPLSIIASCAITFSVFADSGDVVSPVNVVPPAQENVVPTNPADVAPPVLNAAPNPSATLAPTNRSIGS